MNPNLRRAVLVVSSILACGACAACAKEKSGPLPGDSVSEDGAVRLTPPRTDTSPRGASLSPSTGPGAAPEPLGAIEARVFPPELVMDHQAAIALRPEQRDAIQKEIERGQRDMTRLQWELAKEKEKLVSLLDSPKVDEAKVTETSTELMKRENAIKATHLAMLVRVKNVLTPEQQTRLRALRDEERAAR